MTLLEILHILEAIRDTPMGVHDTTEAEQAALNSVCCALFRGCQSVPREQEDILMQAYVRVCLFPTFSFGRPNSGYANGGAK